MLRFRFRSGEQYTLSHCAKLVAIGFIGRDADVCKALVGDADLLLAEVVAQCLDTAEVVVFCTEFEVNNGEFLFILIYQQNTHSSQTN